MRIMPLEKRIKRRYNTHNLITEKPLIIVEEKMEGSMHTVDLYIDSQQKVYATPFVDIVVAKELGVDDFYNFSRVVFFTTCK